MAITREALAALAPLREEIAVPSLGPDATVFVRGLSGWERSEIEKRFTGRDPAKEPGEFRGVLLVACLVDAANAKMFADDEWRTVMELPAAVTEPLFEAACRVNGFTRKDVEDLEKN